MKYYAQERDCGTIRKIIADSDEEALLKAKEIFKSEKVIIGKSLKKGRTKEEQKQLYKESEEIAEKLFGSHIKSAMEIMHKY